MNVYTKKCVQILFTFIYIYIGKCFLHNNYIQQLHNSTWSHGVETMWVELCMVIVQESPFIYIYIYNRDILSLQQYWCAQYFYFDKNAEHINIVV